VCGLRDEESAVCSDSDNVVFGVPSDVDGTLDEFVGVEVRVAGEMVWVVGWFEVDVFAGLGFPIVEDEAGVGAGNERAALR
jgi:hypothetical protein